MTLTEAIKTEALRIGFGACGIAKAEFMEKEATWLKQWLEQGNNANMHYMSNYFDKRTNPQLLLEGAQSIVVVLLNYFPQQQQTTQTPQIAKYAYGQDYHFVVKQKLRQLQDFIQTHADHTSTVFCDSAPLLERSLAQRAGLGWIGKSGLLIHPDMGSYTFIGEIITTLSLDYDTPQTNRCGICSACLEACPTKALYAPYQLNANRCISYLTIEHRDDISEDLKGMMGNRLFGCDACLDACPWNKRAIANNTPELQPHPELFTLDWKHFKRSDYNRLLKSSALARVSYQKLRHRLNDLL